MRIVALALSFGLAASLAAANPATPDGAAALTATLQTYLGTAPGVVRVQPEGASYSVTLDATPLLRRLPLRGAKTTLSPIELQLTDNGDGTWGVTEDQGLDFTATLPGWMDLSLHVGHLASSGTFDTALQTFSQSSATMSDMTVTEEFSDPLLGKRLVTYAVAETQYDSTAEANAGGTVQLSTHFTAQDASEIITLPAVGSAAPIEFRAQVAEVTGDGKITSLRMQAALKLLAFFVAHPDPAAITARQVDLKALVQDLLPVFQHLKLSQTMTALTVQTPVGPFGVDKIVANLAANGLIAAGAVSEDITLDGLTTPAGLVPAWAKDLVPTALWLHLSLSDFDLADPLALALKTLDLAHPKSLTPQQDAAMQAALLPRGYAWFGLDGIATAPAYRLVSEGDITAGPNSAPRASDWISLTGMQAIRDAVKAAPAELGTQIAGALAIAQGSSKPGETGELLWQLELSNTGSLLVNGVDIKPVLNSFGGGQ